MTNKKSPIKTLVDGIEGMHPMYSLYLIQRLEADCEEIKKHLPEIVKENDELEKQGKFALFHPNFYFNYINMMYDLLTDIDGKPREKVSLFEETN